MAFCPKCGVEVHSKKCPLCSYTIKNRLNSDNGGREESSKKSLHLSKKDRYKIFVISTYFASILILGLCITIDLLSSKTISWSVYPTICLLTFAFITTVSIYIKGAFKVALILMFTLLTLLLLDLYIPEVNFFLKVSLPIVCISSILSFFVVLISKRSKRVGLNLASYILISIVLLSISIEVIVQKFREIEVALSWSLITSVSLIPVAIFLLYIHYVLSKKIDLKKVFHT